MPMNSAPVTRRASKIKVINRPKIVNSVTDRCKSPNVTKLSGFAMTIPDILRPRNAMNRPIPAVMPYLSESGIARISASRSGVRLSKRNRIPAMNTVPSTV
ncbi:hypothetical protein D3C77_459800 [compost metagenome]